MVCAYGCGQEASFFIGKSQKPCCSEDFHRCSGYTARANAGRHETALKRWSLTTTKICSTCKVPKDIEKDFYKKPNGRPASSCKNCVRDGLEAWARDNPEQDLASRKRASRTEGSKVSRRKYRRRIRNEVIEKLGGKCSWPGCEWTDPRALQVDHRNGGGLAERKKLKCCNALYRKVLADTTGMYQLLCANHNKIKVYENLEGVRSDHPLAGQLSDTFTDAVHV